MNVEGETTSENVWGKFLELLREGKVNEADHIKSAIEDQQRKDIKKLEKEHKAHVPKYFKKVDGIELWDIVKK